VLLALGALLAGGAIAIGLATIGGGDAGERRGDTRRTATTQAAASEPRRQSKPKPKPQATTTAKAPASAESPRELNDLGFARLPGDPAGAIPLLRRAVDGFRAQGATGDINYAFALFNLGNALRLAGDPAGAIPYLEERLTVSAFKRGIVRRELALAREQAGLGKAHKRGKGDKDDD
jgi:serine/threonine-protein kinase